MNRHLTNEELLDRLYGIARPRVEAHLDECRECASRYDLFKLRRAEATAEPPISRATLDAQRRAIYVRIDGASRSPTRWAPTVAAAVVLVAGVFLYRPLVQIATPPPPAAHAEISDEQLFSEVYSIEQSVEPRAAAPIQGLFDISEPAGEGQE